MNYNVLDPIKFGVPDMITEALGKREGFRHLWLGDSGMGKTFANQYLIQWLRKQRLVDIILSIDDKSRWKAQYEGTYRAHPEHLKREPPHGREDPQHIVFRGIAATQNLKDNVSPKDVTDMAWEMVRLHPCTVLINIDELADATNGSQAWMDDIIPQVYRKGRGVGLSIVATTQMPQLLPREAFGLSDTIGIFRLTSREAEYLKKYRVVEPKHVEIIANLQVGEFMLFSKHEGGIEDNVYKFRR